MTQNEPITINLDEVIESYETGLVDKLRQFGVEGDLFETWVPDPNPAKSIINLMDASNDAGLPANLVVVASRKLLDQLALANLRSELDGRANIEILDQGDSVTIFLSGFEKMESAEPRVTEGVRSSSVPDELGTDPASKDQRTAQDIDHKEKAVAEQSVRNSLYDLSDQVPFKHEGSINNERELCIVVAKKDEHVLELQVDTASHLVQQAMFSGSVPQGLAPLLNRLCESIENRPIQDMSDHAVARLEHQIRNTERRPVPGIVLPLAVDSRFAKLQALVRQALAEYRALTGYLEVSNAFDDDPQATWLDLPDSEKKSQAEEVLRQEAQRLGNSTTEVNVIDIEYNVRVLVRFSGVLALPETDKQPIMMQFEQVLVDNLDPRLELFLEPEQDQSTLRRLSGEE